MRQFSSCRYSTYPENFFKNGGTNKELTKPNFDKGISERKRYSLNIYSDHKGCHIFFLNSASRLKNFLLKTKNYEFYSDY
jgi:hypothetical protein